jgi:solute carrier family 25 (adenine nucleotide translocator) protein 4/5/6/31
MSLESFLLGMAPVLASTTAMYPVNRVKMLMQVQDEIVRVNGIGSQYDGIFDCARRTYGAEGPQGFWRGNAVGLVTCVAAPALNFALKDPAMQLVRPLRGPDDSLPKKLGINVAAGTMVGVCAAGILYPFSYAQVRLAADTQLNPGDSRRFAGAVDVWRRTLVSDGPRGVYRGYAVSVAGSALYRGLYFGLYDTLKRMQPETQRGQSAGPLWNLGLAYGVTIAAGLSAYPLDTIRCCMMMRSMDKEPYRNAFECCRSIVRTGGVLGLWRGASITVVRGLGGAAMLAGYDAITGTKR